MSFSHALYEIGEGIENGSIPKDDENYDQNKRNIRIAKKVAKSIKKRFGE